MKLFKPWCNPFFFVGSVVLLLSTVVVADSVSSGLESVEKNKQIRLFSTESSYADVKDDLLAAIEERGLVISYIAHAKAMFDRTKEVTGEKEPIYDNAEILLFCKSDLSYNLVKKNPHNLIFCPYAISLYVLHTEPKRVYLSYKEQDNSQEVTKPINELLKGIILDAL